jgi:osmoprotectant transport system ATP-binding protein
VDPAGPRVAHRTVLLTRGPAGSTVHYLAHRPYLASLLLVTFFLAPSPPVIRVSHLTKRFGAQVVVDDLSFEVAQGETLVLLGPSGCGKTTLLKTLNRLIEPDGGTIELNGRDVRQQKPEELRRGIGYVIQQVGLLPHLTVAQNVGVVPGLLGRPPAETAARTTELLNRLHLPAERFGPMLPAELSGGQQQRVGLARALAADPPVVLLDEPFGALDPITRAAVRRDFRELDELRRKTVVLVTHDVTEAFELADRIMLLNNGKIQQLGPPRELLLHPASDFVRSFFQAEQLALQLRTITLAEVQPFLPTNLPPAPADAPALPLTASVHEALGQLDADAAPAFRLADQPQAITRGQLLAAFGQALG